MPEDVVGCPRCGGDHLQLEFRRFTRPNPQYTRWAICPVLAEPILDLILFWDGMKLRKCTADEALAYDMDGTVPEWAVAN